MDFQKIFDRALEVREKYYQLEEKKLGKPWTRAQVAQGFVGDVGDLMKLLMAKDGLREIRGVDNIDERLAHELADCLWCILVLSKEYGVNLEKVFLENMQALEERISQESI